MYQRPCDSWYNRPMEKKNKLLLIDGSSVAFRAFFALYHQIDRFKNANGLHTNAVYGFNLMLSHLLERIQPTHVLVAFDAGKTTFRTEMYADYKGGRAKTPDEFREQFPFIREQLDHLGIRHYELAQYEADDIIGTLDKMAEATSVPFEVTIVSGDKDLIQLTDDNTVVEISKKGVAEFEEFTPAYLKEKMGLTPEQFIDLKALMGDKSDNIPGVTKIGEKTGIKLLLEYGSLDGIYEHIDEMKASKMKENLINDKEQAYLSKTLATIDTDAPIEIGLDDITYTGPHLENLAKFYEEMGFKQLRQALDLSGEEAAPVAIDYTEVEQVTSDMLTEDSFFHFEIFGDNYHTEPIIGFAWGTEGQLYASTDTGLLQTPIFKEFLEKTPLKVYDFKRAKVLLSHLGISLQNPAFDSRLAKYLLSTVEDNEISTIASLYSQIALPLDEVVYGKGAKRAIPEKAVLLEHLARKVAVLLDTEEPMMEQLQAHDQLDLLYDMEQPLAAVLAKMEIAGIKVERQTLEDMQVENEVVLERLTQEIYELAGEEFNINSPKQLGEALFIKLGLPAGKKTKTGYSTNAEVLEKLRYEHPVVELILEYRTLAKIKSTYCDGLLKVVEEDGRIHSSFNQTETRTGRISSTEPNLQNIPVRTDVGRELRKFFVAKEGCVLVDADYSQIELRVLAHVANDSGMIEAFKENDDIHRNTAAQVFHMPREMVTPLMRSRAKAVNFGIIYGIGAFSLAKNIGVTRKEAEEYIKTYLDHFSGVRNYMTNVVEHAKETGYVETLFGRRRYLPELSSSNFNLRSFGERVAMNMPIQGTAADIIKIAMIRVVHRLEKEGLRARLILQVHDELIVEAPEEEAPLVQQLLTEEMEQAIHLSVPMVAEATIGKTWYDAKA